MASLICMVSVLSLYLIVPFCSGVPGNVRVRDITDDLNQLMSLAGGDYDNLAQYNSDIARGLPPKDRHMHLHAKFYETKIPALGDNSFFYVQEHENGDPTQVYSQSINSFYINITTWVIRMRIYKFVDPATAKKYINAFDHPVIFDQLQPSDLKFNDDCGVTWTRLGPELFVGKMTMGACVLPYKDTNIIIYDENFLSKSYLTVHEQWFVKSNGTEILGKLSPYNETRQIMEPPFSRLAVKGVKL
ncbi:uncharacterized protein LOC135477248 [Liolophura sinensis]|uniref:uncharacterized protein LOC135477248 n=1 Tax=Liolophura sinensis TaxID=3198878 RepID=UPI00315949C2